MNLSKLQSEAVIKLNRLEMDDDGCAVCLGEMMSLVNLKLLEDFITDQIQKAYEAGHSQGQLDECKALLSIQSKRK